MSAFTRIDPEHPLTQAARYVNDLADERGLNETLEEIGMNVTTSELAYLAEQRTYRAVAAQLGLKLGENSALDELIAVAITNSPLWEDMSTILMAAYMDGMAIGWKGREISTSVEVVS